MKPFLQIPLFVFLLAAYNIVVFTMPHLVTPTGGDEGGFIESQLLLSQPLLSGSIWHLYFNDVLVISGVFILFLELFKSTRTNVSSIVEHVLSMFVFIGFLVEFIVVKPCGNSTFLILTLLSMLDVIAGFTISISTARRDLAVPASD